MTKLLLAVLVLAASSAHSAEVYKCTDSEGNLTFSQQPCEGEVDAEVIEVKHTTSGVDIAGDGDWSKVDADNAARAASRQLEKNIATRQRNITTLRNERDAKIAALRDGQGNARNNAAGAAYHSSLATEIQTVTQEYRAKIQTEQDAINKLREQY